jgi:protocatechuate 3,4-dioxygenase beta subunit
MMARDMMTRRDALRGLAAGAAGANIESSIESGNAPAEAAPAVPSAASQPTGVCVLFPQAVEGPYYFDPKLVRRDIAEGQQGTPLRLVLRVLELGACTPIGNARVDVWHADAGGIYSGYAGQGDNRNVSTKGKTYLRGTQFSGKDGLVEFQSVYPGWYPGRTPHIHIKIFLDEKTVLTGQIYFPDALSAKIYRERAPYNLRPTADTTNSADFIFKSGEREGGGTVLAVEENADLVQASLVIGVDRTGKSAAASSGWRGWFRSLFGG